MNSPSIAFSGMARFGCIAASILLNSCGTQEGCSDKASLPLTLAFVDSATGKRLPIPELLFRFPSKDTVRYVSGEVSTPRMHTDGSVLVLHGPPGTYAAEVYHPHGRSIGSATWNIEADGDPECQLAQSRDATFEIAVDHGTVPEAWRIVEMR